MCMSMRSYRTNAWKSDSGEVVGKKFSICFTENIYVIHLCHPGVTQTSGI